ncbi:MAG TPA: hypothetical protein EYG82_04360 [Sulfurovum sp.]|nr:hypothetical protein [Sulfurovum sp.]
MGTIKELLLVYPSMERVFLKESVNVMLTPQFYTLKKEALPVKYAYQAKKIAPSLFEGLLEESSSYEYIVFKEEEQWVFIAYDMDKIVTFLASKGIEGSMVSKIYFTQQAVDKFSAPMALGEKEALVVLDESVVVVPLSALGEEESPSLKFDKAFTPQKGVSLQGNMGSFLTKKQAYSLAGILLLFAGLFVAEGSRYSGEEGGEEELQALYEAHPSLQSSYKRDAILQKYKSIDIQERKKRDSIKKLSAMIFKGVTLTHLSMNESKHKADFTCVSANVSKKLEELAKKENYKVSKVKNSHNLNIEGTL